MLERSQLSVVMSWRELRRGRGGGNWKRKGGEAYRSICPSLISCAFICDLKSGSGAVAAVGDRGITTPVGVLSGDGCDIVYESKGYCKTRFLFSVCSKSPNSSRTIISPEFVPQLYILRCRVRGRELLEASVAH